MRQHRTMRIGMLVLLLVSCAGIENLRGQTTPAAPNPNQSNSDEASPTPGRQLVHESREAAGEEKDEMDEFKHSASVQAVHRLTGLSVQQSYWACFIFN